MPLDHRNKEFARKVSPGMDALHAIDQQMADARERQVRLRDKVCALERELALYRRIREAVPAEDLERVEEVIPDTEAGYPAQSPRRCWVLVVGNG